MDTTYEVWMPSVIQPHLTTSLLFAHMQGGSRGP